MDGLKRIIHLLDITMAPLLGVGQCIVEGRLWDQGTTALTADTLTQGWEDTIGGKRRAAINEEHKNGDDLN